MQYKRFGNAVAVVLASVVGLSVSTSIKPIQAETSSDTLNEVAAKVTPDSENVQSEPEVRLDVAKVGESASQQTDRLADVEVPALSLIHI